jgi:hypothetical protein
MPAIQTAQARSMHTGAKTLGAKVLATAERDGGKSALLCLLEHIGLRQAKLKSPIVDVLTSRRVPVRAVLVWAPTSGSVSIFSYRGEVAVGLTHSHVIADPGAIVTRIDARLTASGRQSRARSAGGPAPPTKPTSVERQRR